MYHVTRTVLFNFGVIFFLRIKTATTVSFTTVFIHLRLFAPVGIFLVSLYHKCRLIGINSVV